MCERYAKQSYGRESPILRNILTKRGIIGISLIMIFSASKVLRSVRSFRKQEFIVKSVFVAPKTSSVK